MLEVVELHGTSILQLPPEGELIREGGDAVALIGDAWGYEVSTIAVPVARFAPEFFQLRSGVLGEVAQKFTNYRIRLVVVGDITAQVAASNALRDFVRETNQYDAMWFVAGMEELAERLNR